MFLSIITAGITGLSSLLGMNHDANLLPDSPKYAYFREDRLHQLNVFERHAKSTLVIKGVDANGRVMGIGSGIMISPDGRALTAYHVIDHKVRFIAEDYMGNVYDVQVVRGNKDIDTALLKIDPKPGLEYVKFGNSDALKPGDWLSQFGNGIDKTGKTKYFSEDTGYVEELHFNVPNSDPIQDFIKVDNDISPGDSGGGVLNEQGQLIGISTRGDGTQGLLVPTNLISKYLDLR